MKTSRILSAALLVTGLALGFAGCAQQPTIASTHRASPRSAKTFALSVTMSDGTRITPEQWATVKAAFEQQLAAAGYTLVDDVTQAERIIRVVFTPAFDDPANGTATVMSVRDNPMYAYNSRNYGTPAFASYGFSSGLGLGYGSSLYGMGYYDDNYYSYGSSSSVVTPRHEPPNHNRPNNPDNCQPGDNNRHNGGQFATHDGSHRGPTPGSSNGGHWTPSTRLDSGSGSSFSSPSYSSGSSSYSGPTSSSYSGSSHSLPSASFGGGSSSSSSSSYSSGSSSFSSGSSSDFSSSSSSSSYSAPSVSSSSGSSGGSSEITNRSAN